MRPRPPSPPMANGCSSPLTTAFSSGTLRAQRKTTDWLKPSEGRQNIVISPDGQCLVTGGDDRIAAWDLATARQFTELRERFSSGGNLLKLAFAPRGQTVAAGNEDGSLFLWDVTPEKPARPIAPDARLGESRLRVKDLAFFPDGRTLLVAGEQRVSFWDMEPGRFRDYQVRCPYHIGGIALSPDGKTLVAAPGETLLAGGIDFWDPSTGKLTRRFQRVRRLPGSRFLPGRTLVGHQRSGRRRSLGSVHRCQAGCVDIRPSNGIVCSSPPFSFRFRQRLRGWVGLRASVDSSATARSSLAGNVPSLFRRGAGRNPRPGFRCRRHDPPDCFERWKVRLLEGGHRRTSGSGFSRPRRTGRHRHLAGWRRGGDMG